MVISSTISVVPGGPGTALFNGRQTSADDPSLVREGAVLIGRARECSQLGALFAEASPGRSRVLVLRGEPGVGKTGLLEYAISSAPEWRVVRTVGVESEAELAFAALHQLCSPSLEALERLPGPQRDALRAAFGLEDGTRAERFLVGLATLSLLSAAAADRPLLCVVDDAQWLDRESAQALAFVARRLVSEPVVMLFATRDDNGDEFAGLPEMVVQGLAYQDANKLLSSVVSGVLSPSVRDRVIAETRGNPLALLELPRGLAPAELSVGFGAPAGVPLPRRIEETFGRRISRLPVDTQRLLLVAAADHLGDAAKVWRPVEILGIPKDAAGPADEADLLEIGTSVRFRHPLVRSAVYRSASSWDRRLAHRALAQATDLELDPDRRAWHLAAAAAGPDEAIAGELERSAGRAHQRGGCVAAATLLERSAELTPAPVPQALRRLLASATFLQSGSIDKAQELLALTSGRLVDPAARAQAMRIEGALRFVQGQGGDTPTLLFGAAIALRELDHRLACEAMMEAVEAAMWAGHLTSGATVGDVAEAVQTWSQPEQGTTTAALLLRGYAERLIAGYPAPVEWWRQAVRARADDVSGSARLQLLGMLWNATGDMLDFENNIAIARERVRQAREEGALAVLPIALACLAWSELLAGRTDVADALNAEGTSIASATGAPEFPGAHGIIRLGILAWRGQDVEASQLAEEVVSEAVRQGQGLTVNIVDFVLAVLHLGHGRYEDARRHALAVCEADSLYVCSMSLADLVEAAWRSGDPDTAKLALARLSERAYASEAPWALGLCARASALVADDAEAEPLYLEALEQLGRSGVHTDLARAHLLYGEWLRRQRRRIEAREQLRRAHQMFLETRAGGFASRAEAELLATGEHARQRTDETRKELTPQELQVAQLAADGGSNGEIAAQLYISPHTVSYHLRKVYAKLEVRSRSQLAKVLGPTGSA
jgi:DNA-binding CsgD family transcriptional regulator